MPERTTFRAVWPQTALGALVAFVFAPLVLAAVIGSSRITPPATVDQQMLGTLWQVQGAVVGFAIALAIYGYQALGRTGPVESDDLAGFLLPSTVAFGISLVLLTGTAFFLRRSEVAGQPQLWVSWLAIGSYVLSLAWALLLLRALPEAVRMADPNVRTQLRLRRLQALATRAARRRIVELVSAAMIREIAAANMATWQIWPSFEDVPGTRRITAGQAGYVADLHVRRIESFLRRNPGAELYLALDARVTAGQELARTRADVARGTRVVAESSYVLDSEPYSARVSGLIQSLTDDARRAITAQPNTVGDILDGYADALGAYADSWRQQVGTLEAGHLQGALSLDTTPFGSILDAVRDLTETAISVGGREPFGQLSYFPGKLARIGLEHGTGAYLSALSLYPFIYDFGARNTSAPGSAYARGCWFYLMEFFDLILLSLGRRGQIDAKLIEQAASAARSTIIRVGRLMILRSDFELFDALMERLDSAREDDYAE